ncbi:MAG: ABC transporter ATP-binding protein [Lachnospiraceae bacterium]|nr:ABC transporter ATP-binding protein [Lachnospiraceae bacterium]
MSKLLHVEDLNIEFHDHLIPETVVYDFDLDMEPGEIVGLVGESGSGKSMSALAVAGLLSRHDMKKRGVIEFEGKNILSCSRSELRELQGDEICMIFQEPLTSLNPVKKIGWQVEEGLKIHTDMSPEERKKRAIKALEDVEIEDAQRVYDSYPHELSGGMRQRVMIAAATIGNPKLLIADEPTTALDVTVQSQIVELMKKINREKKTAILFISHDLSLVSALCERVLVMKGGYVVESGSVKEIFESPKEEYTRKLIDAIPKCGSTEDLVENGEPLAGMKDINVSFIKRKGKNKEKVHVLKDISLDIYEGEILGLVGESGCGKSTLAKTLLGLIKPDTGHVSAKFPNTQMIFQDPYGSLNPSKTVGFIMEEPLRNLTDKTPEERYALSKEMIEKVGLSEEFLQRYPSELSGGQRQRVCIATALMLGPKLIIADEPVSALDVTIQAEVLKLMMKLHMEMGISFLFISHDLRVVHQMCDRIMVMKDGEIVESGDRVKIYENPSHPYTKELLKSAGLGPGGVK